MVSICVLVVLFEKNEVNRVLLVLVFNWLWILDRVFGCLPN